MVVAEGGGKEVEREIEFYICVGEEGNGWGLRRFSRILGEEREEISEE